MSKNLLVISADVRETRVALIEDGIIAELHIERKGAGRQTGTVGDVVLGKVTRVLPGLQAAFIDVGQERAAFLHVEDLIRPDDFETYLAGGRKHAVGADDGPAEDEVDVDEAASPVGPADMETLPQGTLHVEARAPEPPPSLSEVHAEAEALAEADPEDSDDLEDEESRALTQIPAPLASGVAIAPASGESMRETAPTLPEVGDEGASDDSGDLDDESGEDLDEEDTIREDGSAADVTAAVATTQQSRPRVDLDLDDLGGLPGFTVTEPGEPVPRAAPAPRANDGGGRGRRRGRGRGRGGDRGGERGGGGGDRGGDRGGNRSQSRGPGDRGGDRPNTRSGGGGGRGERSNGAVPNRISKSTPIREVVKEGDEIIVQISKDPIGTKGARCTSHVSLPGRYVVYLPTVEHIGISKRIGSDKERGRLREAIEQMKPPTGGLIVRTVAEGLTKKQLKADVGYLVRLWGEIAKGREGAKAPTLLMSELDIVLKTARDLFTDEIDQMVVDDRNQYDRLCRFVEMFAPERVKDIIYYQGDEPIFDAYGIEDEIGRALSRKVPLPSGGHLIIDQAEALTAIDVNTGRFVGKGSKDMEETILKTNLEAVQEIAYQLRFRNIGGLIILDLIDMEKHKNREAVRRKLEDLLQKDKAKTTLNRISDLGLIEMTRKRTRESLGRLLHEPCFYCDGTGQLQSKETIAYEILREIRRKKADLPGYTVLVNVHPAVADLLQGAEKAALAEVENKFMRKITVVPRKDYHLEQFDIAGK